MNRLLPRTSITVDEAVAILLGHASGPIEIEPFDDSEDAEANCPAFSLGILEDERDVLEGEYDLAKHEKRSARVVAEKLEALKRQQVILDQANDHLCAIHDELNKGERSMLRVDRELSNDAYTYVTLHSFNEWAKRRGSESAGAVEAATPSATSAAPTAVVTKRKHGTTQLNRRDAIFAVIVSRGLNPKALPNFNSGKAGLRADIREAVQTLQLFKGSPRLFNRAWEDLFDEDIDGRLAYEK